jgi:zinc D-Ala-D-Ala carboxypeptidase
MLKNLTAPTKSAAVENMDKEFLEMLDNAREIAGVPFVITSGFRTKAHNKKVGGKEDSAHLTGHAADIKVGGSRQRFKIVEACIQAGFTRIGIASTFVHVDNDTTKAAEVIWTY